ncbi:hypothetical protein G7A66_09815 [Altererythrobacter sp. SALINAS58]|uniref:hypothetical protein n=1 Tax=Alteripontixanthobacter muriae TaxID=2705546 RepID=UPI0015753B28|nr:hypothetical protein [Alteripontixanthobacter muriae]NTZ43373.1 hypothetical protein [Alteripontixanthobacter muriae]
MLFWMFIGAGVLLLILRLWVGPPDRTGARPARRRLPQDDRNAPGDEPDLWTVEAVQRYGTPDTAADLASEGRAGELRGLGYDGLGEGEGPER